MVEDVPIFFSQVMKRVIKTSLVESGVQKCWYDFIANALAGLVDVENAMCDPLAFARLT